jgi:chloride channel 7
LIRYGTAFAVFLVSNFALTMLATVLTVYVAPAAAGSGIPEVKAYLNGVDAPDIFSLKTLVVKVDYCYISFIQVISSQSTGNS